MQCNQCGCRMQQTDTVTESGVRQTWYRCPLCAAGQTISQPCQRGLRRIGNAQRCSCASPDPTQVGSPRY